MRKTLINFNKIRMNKKAQSPEVFIVIAAVLVLIVGLIVLGNLKGRLPTEVSKANIELISQYSKGENILLFMDESARLASNNVIDEIYSDSLNSGCETIDGLMLWKNESELCVPNNKEIANLLLSKFTSQFNNHINNFNIYSEDNISLPEFTPGDIYVDQEQNKLIGYPFKYMIIGDNPKYEFGIRFSQTLPISMFNHGAEEVINKINTRCSQKEDLNIEKYEFTECVNNVLDEVNKNNKDNDNKNNNNKNQNFNTEELVWQSGEICGDDLLNFVREYNNCARSHDNFCECESKNNYSKYKIDGNKVEYNNQSYDLELPFDTETQQILPLYKSDNMLHLDSTKDNIDTIHPNVPLCRLNDRYVNLCLREGKHKLHFQAYVDDRAKPQPITLTETKLEDGITNYTWQPSLSGDVKEYLIFVAKSDLPFPSIESTPTSTIERELRYTQNLSYIVDSGFKAKIVPIDYSGNLGG